jgi:hypothetical protein
VQSNKVPGSFKGCYNPGSGKPKRTKVSSAANPRQVQVVAALQVVLRRSRSTTSRTGGGAGDR